MMTVKPSFLDVCATDSHAIICTIARKVPIYMNITTNVNNKYLFGG